MSRRLAKHKFTLPTKYTTATEKKLKASAAKFREDFKDLESTEYAESMVASTKDFQITPEYITPLSAKLQFASMNGLFGLNASNKDKYYSAEHFDLVKQIVPLRQHYRNPKLTVEARKEAAQKEINAWLEYYARRKEFVSEQPDAWIQHGSIKLLKEAFDRHRNRDTMCVDANDIIDAHGSFSKTFKFQVPIHPKNLSQMIHPHQGYMVSMPNHGYSWDDMMSMYELQMVASYEKSQGRDLHGEELSALAFWLIVDSDKRGYLNEMQLKKLMHGLRFPDIHNFSQFRQAFDFQIKKGEFSKTAGYPMLRFDLMRQIFLDHGL